MEEKSGFHVVIRPWRLIIGFLAGIGYLILLQQYGLVPVTTMSLVTSALLGLVVGIALPTLATLIPHKPRGDKPAAASPEEHQ